MVLACLGPCLDCCLGTATETSPAPGGAAWVSIWVREVIAPGITQGKAAGTISKVTGQYRTAHSRLLQHAEAIVCYGGTRREMARLGARSSAFFSEWRAMCNLGLKSSCAMMIQVGHGLQLQSLWTIPTAAVS